MYEYIYMFIYIYSAHTVFSPSVDEPPLRRRVSLNRQVLSFLYFISPNGGPTFNIR